MSNVFVAQRPCYRAADNTWADKYDLTPAEAFGDLVDILPPGTVRDLPSAWIAVNRMIRDRYNPDEDFLLALGDPTLVGLMFHAAMTKATEPEVGRAHRPFAFVRVLRWDRKDESYRNERLRL